MTALANTAAPLRLSLAALTSSKVGQHLSSKLDRAYVTHDLDDASSGTQLAFSLHRGPDVFLTRQGISDAYRPSRRSRHAEGDEAIGGTDYGRINFKPITDKALSAVPAGFLKHVEQRMKFVAANGIANALDAYKTRASERGGF